MRLLRRLLLLVSGVLALVAGLYLYFLYMPEPDFPPLHGTLNKYSLKVDSLSRTFYVYTPAETFHSMPVVFVLHGSQSTAGKIRRSTAYEFDALADRRGFLVVYPEGFENHWNDCRASATYASNTWNIDDVGFFSDMIDFLVSRYGIDPSRAFVTGYSNGGHMAFRLALEVPELVAGIAPISANLPVGENLDCKKLGQPLPVAMFVGTRDPINPFHGGLVTVFGDSSRGSVLSSEDSARYWADLASAPRKPATIRHPERDGHPETEVTELRWVGAEGIEVRLYRLQGSGHVVPTQIAHFPRIMGGNAGDISGPEKIVDFFLRVALQSFTLDDHAGH